MKTDKDIEQLLQRGKSFSLSAQDHAAIKSELLEHAKQTLKYDVPLRSPLSSLFMRSGVVAAVFLFMIGGVGFASTSSTPGEPLYLIKVHVVEEAVGLTKLDEHTKVAYDLSLMETRLRELKTLSVQQELLSAEDLNLVADQIDEYISEVTHILENTDETEVSFEEKIETLSRLSSIVKSQKRVSEGSAFASMEEDIADAQRDVRKTLDETIEDFTEESSPEAVGDYISDQISEVSVELNATTTGAGTRTDAEKFLHDANEALIEGDTAEALSSVMDTQQIIAIEDYLEDAPAIDTDDAESEEESR